MFWVPPASLGTITPSISLWASGGFFWVPVCLFSCGVWPWPFQSGGMANGLETGPAPRSHAVCSLARRGSPLRAGSRCELPLGSHVQRGACNPCIPTRGPRPSWPRLGWQSWPSSLTGDGGGGGRRIRVYGSFCPASSSWLFQGLGTVAAFLGQPGHLARLCSVGHCQLFSKPRSSS